MREICGHACGSQKASGVGLWHLPSFVLESILGLELNQVGYLAGSLVFVSCLPTVGITGMYNPYMLSTSMGSVDQNSDPQKCFTY